MASKQAMDTIEKTLDVAADTVNTLERIPKVWLNGTTKNQQILILSTVALSGVLAGVVLTKAVPKAVKRIRTRRDKPIVDVVLDTPRKG